MTTRPSPCAARAGADTGLRVFLSLRGRRGSGVNGRPKAVARTRDAQASLSPEDGPHLARPPGNSGSEAATFLPRSLYATNKEESI
jgi:hypothetical protein